MATVSQWNPYGVSLNLTATVAEVTRSSASKYKVKFNVSWETYWSNAKTNYGMSATSGGVTKVISEFGTSRSSGSATFTGTYSISGNASATKTVTVTFKNYEEDWEGNVTTSSSKSISLSVTVPAWTSYTVKYNANGGSGAPSSQTKWKDQDLTLSSTKPTRTGYTFSKWNTAKDGSGTSYSAGAKYTANSGTTLYAQWTANKYTITYNANGGTLGDTKTQTKTHDDTLTLKGTATRTNYTFLGWSTSKTATSATYKTGSSFTTNASVTLYAVWSAAYAKPRITKYSVDRCDEDGAISDEGIYALVKFNWATDIDVDSITIGRKLPSASQWTIMLDMVDSGVSGTSGTVSCLITNYEFAVDATYDIQVNVSDSSGYLTKNATLPGTAFPIDCKDGSTGVAFGGPATIDDAADCYYDFLARQDIRFRTNNKRLYGTRPNDVSKQIEVLNPQNANGNTVLGYGNFADLSGNTNIYGYDIYMAISNTADGTASDAYKPYRRRDDSMTFNTVRTSGFVTNSGKSVYFWIPLAIPLIGVETVEATCVDGFVLRQGGNYTHGSDYVSSTYTYAIPDSMIVYDTPFAGVWVRADFSDTTNAINNDSIGITWSGTLYFS